MPEVEPLPALCSLPQRPGKRWGYTKRKAACVATSGPSLGRKRPRRAAIAGWGWGGRYRIPLAKTIAISGSIERKGSRTDTKVYGARPQGRALPQWVDGVEKGGCCALFSCLALRLNHQHVQAFDRLWAKREEQLKGVLDSSAGLYGDLQGIAGRAMSEIEGLSPLMIESKSIPSVSDSS